MQTILADAIMVRVPMDTRFELIIFIRLQKRLGGASSFMESSGGFYSLADLPFCLT
jgi:hypothetical protein